MAHSPTACAMGENWKSPASYRGLGMRHWHAEAGSSSSPTGPASGPLASSQRVICYILLIKCK